MDGAIEFLEDFRLFVGRNTNAIISYGQFYQLVIPDNDYADIDSRAGIFNRILYQVTQNIGNMHRISCNQWEIRWKSSRKSNLFSRI